MAAMVGALAFIPIVWYGLTRSGTGAVISAINVVIILAAMAIVTSSAEGSDHHDVASA
jgi:hypothetical protein